MGAPSLETRIQSFLFNWSKNTTESSQEIPSYSEIYHPELGLLSSSTNQVQEYQQPLYHSEWIVIQEACKKLGSKYLSDCMLLTALEPCLHCTGAILKSNLREVIYFLPCKPGEGVSSLSIEMIYLLNHFPRLQLVKNEAIFSKFKDFFIDKR